MEIFELKNYGKIEINLKAIMEKKNISKNRLAKMVGTDNNVINRYYNGELSKLDVDILAMICYVLECNISDLIKYKK